MAIEKVIQEKFRTEIDGEYVEVVVLSKDNNVTTHIFGNQAIIFRSISEMAKYVFLAQPVPRIYVDTKLLQKVYTSFHTFAQIGENFQIIE